MKLHQEFQIGAHDANDLASFLSRCDTVIGSVTNAANLAALKLKGWTDAETTAFQTARNTFGPAEQFRAQSISGAKDTTTTKDTDAATLYENVLTIQNAADLQWPASNPANAGVRGRISPRHLPARPRRQPRAAADSARAANAAGQIIMTYERYPQIFLTCCACPPTHSVCLGGDEHTTLESVNAGGFLHGLQTSRAAPFATPIHGLVRRRTRFAARINRAIVGKEVADLAATPRGSGRAASTKPITGDRI